VSKYPTINGRPDRIWKRGEKIYLIKGFKLDDIVFEKQLYLYYRIAVVTGTEKRGNTTMMVLEPLEKFMVKSKKP
jgi:hypothetical protein